MLSSFFINSIYVPFSSGLKTDVSRRAYLRSCQEMSEVTGGKDFLAFSKEDVALYARHLIDRVRLDKIKHRYASVLFAYPRSVAAYIEANYEQLGLASYTNPFKNFVFPAYDSSICATSVPSNMDIDALLTQAAGDKELYVALTLIIRLCLTSGDVIRIRLDDFKKLDDGSMVLSTKKSGKVRYLSVPEDVMTIVDDYLAIRYAVDHDFLLSNSNGDRLSLRVLNYRFRKAASDVEDFSGDYSLNDIRNCSIAYMQRCGASYDELSKYLGVSSRWMYKYTHAVEHMDIITNDYSNILIKRNR